MRFVLKDVQVCVYNPLAELTARDFSYDKSSCQSPFSYGVDNCAPDPPATRYGGSDVKRHCPDVGLECGESVYKYEIQPTCSPPEPHTALRSTDTRCEDSMKGVEMAAQAA